MGIKFHKFSFRGKKFSWQKIEKLIVKMDSKMGGKILHQLLDPRKLFTFACKG